MSSEFQSWLGLPGLLILTASIVLDIVLLVNWLRYERTFSKLRTTLTLLMLVIEVFQAVVIWVTFTSKFFASAVVVLALVAQQAFLTRGITFLKGYEIYWNMYDSGRIKEKRDGAYYLSIIFHFVGIVVAIGAVVVRQLNINLLTFLSVQVARWFLLGIGVLAVIFSWAMWLWFLRLFGAQEKGPKALLSMTRMYVSSILTFTLVPILDAIAVEFFLNGATSNLLTIASYTGETIVSIVACSCILISKQINLVMLGYTLWDVCFLPTERVLKDEVELMNAVAPDHFTMVTHNELTRSALLHETASFRTTQKQNTYE
jgi:hypothetical protein